MIWRCPTDVDSAADSWGANCGPSAIAAAFGLDLACVREAVSGKARRFKGHMGIPDVVRACKALGRPCTKQSSNPGPLAEWPKDGPHIGMVQVGGPWLNNKWEAAKRRHLVAVRWDPASKIWRVYDVNAGEWVPARAWGALVMDRLAADQEVYAGSDGTWHFSWRGTIAGDVVGR